MIKNKVDEELYVQHVDPKDGTVIHTYISTLRALLAGHFEEANEYYKVKVQRKCDVFISKEDIQDLNNENFVDWDIYKKVGVECPVEKHDDSKDVEELREVLSEKDIQD